MTEDLFNTAPPPAFTLLAEVALERGTDTFTYGVPATLPDLKVGQRVIVPLGRSNQHVAGFVVRLHQDKSPHALKGIVERDANSVALTEELVELARWMAGYYCTPLGMVFTAMLPAAVKHGTGAYARTVVDLSALTPSIVHGDSASADPPPKKEKLPAAQAKVLQAAAELARTQAAPPTLKELADAAGVKTTAPALQLVKKGLLATKTLQALRSDPLLEAVEQQNNGYIADERLTWAQKRAVDRIADRMSLRAFSVTLLHGVTGSGKTEVYLRAIERLLARAQVSRETPGENPERSLPGVIVLVPEIALTPQTVARFAHRYQAMGLAVLHSGLTAAQRHAQWQRIRQGQARLVVGARSAVFAPLPRVDLIIVDEEHEPSYKQDQLPRYHARDLAVKRAQLAGATVILGSATPSLESWWNAGGESSAPGIPADRPPAPRAAPTAPSRAERESQPRKAVYQLVELPQRVTGLKLPAVEIVDLTEERKKRYQMTGAGGIHLLSLRLEAALRHTLETGGQTILLLNRRGYANFIACPDHRCGWIKQCDYCDVTMVLHRDARLPAGEMLRCHHCQAEQLLPATCPVCGRKISVFGLGTQRVEEELARKFPDAALERMDADTMRRAGDYHAALQRFSTGETRILLGTQMIAKGLDFPGVRLVGVISADTALHLPDFRAGERTFQLIAQVAGRAGRGSEPGRVIVQTFNPQDPSITLAAQHDYPGFAAREIALRTAVGLPPVTRMARIVCRDKDMAKVKTTALRLMEALALGNEMLGTQVRLRGPMTCAIARIAQFHRWQIEMLAQDAASLQKLLAHLRRTNHLKSDARTAIDVDPVSLL